MLQTKDCGSGGASIQPVARAHLQAADIVLPQQREQPVVGVFADAVQRVHALRHRPARVQEDAEQDQRVGSGVAREVVRRQAERQRDAGHHAVTQRRDLAHVLEHRVAKARQHVVAGQQVAAVQRYAGAHARVLVGQFGAQVQAFLPVGPAGRELAAQREPAAPGAPAQRHRVARLDVLGQCEEAVAQAFEPLAQRLVDAVANQIEEAMLATGAADAGGDLVVAVGQVHDRQRAHRRQSTPARRRSSSAGVAAHSAQL